jgi:hypothetical protein
VTVLIDQSSHVTNYIDTGTLRCVTVESLRVRDKPSTDAKIIDKLGMGHLVDVIDREGIWSFVKYAKKDENELRTGWVSSTRLSAKLCVAKK